MYINNPQIDCLYLSVNMHKVIVFEERRSEQKDGEAKMCGRRSKLDGNAVDS